jgi:TctA family transporter
MSAGSYSIFFTHPISATMLAVALVLLLHGLRAMFRRTTGGPSFMDVEPAEGRERK